MTTATMTLTDFLLARIAEDEAVARVQVRPFEHLNTRDGTAISRVERNRAPYVTCGITSGRVLAECEAKRRIVTMHTQSRAAVAEYEVRGHVEAGDEEKKLISLYGGRLVLEAVVLALAAVYADHPDYREEWRP